MSEGPQAMQIWRSEHGVAVRLQGESSLTSAQITKNLRPDHP